MDRRMECVRDTCAARKDSIRSECYLDFDLREHGRRAADGHHYRRSHRHRRRQRQRFPVGRFGVPRHGDARRLLTREDAKERERRGRGKSFFRSRTSRSLPLVPPEYPTLRSRNAVSSPVDSLDNSSAFSLSFFLSISLFFSLAVSVARRLDGSQARIHTRMHTASAPYVFLSFSFPFTLLPLSPSRVQRSVLSLAATTEIPRRLIAPVDALCLDSAASSSLHSVTSSWGEPCVRRESLRLVRIRRKRIRFFLHSQPNDQRARSAKRVAFPTL